MSVCSTTKWDQNFFEVVRNNLVVAYASASANRDTHSFFYEGLYQNKQTKKRTRIRFQKLFDPIVGT